MPCRPGLQRRRLSRTRVKASVAQAPPGASMTVCVAVIEDSKEILAVLEDLLGTLGEFDVVARCATESEAAIWLEEHPHSWELALIDLVLRDGSGFNVIRRYRAANEHARILVLSDYATPVIRVSCVELGADAVFTKGEIKAFSAYLQRASFAGNEQGPEGPCRA